MKVEVAWQTIFRGQLMSRQKWVGAYLVVTLVGPSELTDQSNEDQFSNLRQFRVDDSNQSGKDRGKRQR
jgi:hypothetical protein